MSNQPKSYKKFIATAATATLVATAIIPTASAAEAKAFTDVNKNYKTAVDYLVSQNITKGINDTTFGTDQPIKRGDAAIFIAKALDLDTVNAPDAGFKDVNSRVKGAVNAIVQAKIAGGKSETTFAPDDNITRAEMSKLLVNAYNLQAGDTKNTFTDVNNTWDPYVDALLASGVTMGLNETTFGATQDVTRGQFALFIYRGESTKPEPGKAPEVVSVDAANAKQVKLAGSALDQLKASQLSVEGNKILSVVASANGKEATVTFETAVKSGAEQTLKFTEKVEGEADKVNEFKFTYTLEVNAVEGTSERLDDDTNKQFLGFTINDGEAVSVQYLVDAGYTVEFQSTKDLFASTSTGEVDASKIADGDKFAYKVVITKGDTTVESKLTNVEVLDFATYLTSISEVSVTQGAVAVKSNKVTVEDKNVTVAATKATALNGATINSPKVTYKSSNPAIATVDATTGVVTPIKPGNVTITMEADDAKKEVPLTVVSGAREVAQVTATSTSVKLLASKTQTIDVTVVDQYGDEFEGNVDVVSKDAKIATVSNPVAITNGKGTATIAAVAKGNTTVEVKAGDQVLKSVSVAVSDDSAVASRKIETVSASADYALDVVTGSDDASLDIVWNQYNAGGFLIGPEKDFTNDDLKGTKYTVSSSDNSVATVSVATNGTITVGALKPGTANIQIKEGTVTRASVQVTVVNTTPTITAVNFETVEDVTTNGALNVQALKAEGITLSSTDYTAEIHTDGTIFVDVDTTEGLTDGDIKLGKLGALYSGTPADITSLSVNAGSVVAANVAAGAEGTIVVRVVKEGETSAFATSTITVKVPQ
ncbi:S-layer homology domain-containing protein [Sporosarcina sp. HYO08]|uniref:S-layer homology domain-containing protein n=1 Tax=Sporosarcina sp. HYO08 TaxID=1759557 RepID=UPI0007932653|nr:S-layer homology domain-containing protein [Sporosarcina sp. HYO08]KXH84029.1 hypothetical protein AU377_04550 [Sporosarcina sp. HYO08]